MVDSGMVSEWLILDGIGGWLIVDMVNQWLKQLWLVDSISIGIFC